MKSGSRFLLVAAVVAQLGAATARASAAPPPARVLVPCLSGFVRDGSGVGVSNADLDFIIPATGQKLITPGDNTDASGFYVVCVLQGVYDVTFAPPPGTRLLGKLVPGLDLTQNTARELNVTLETGWVFSGRVVSAADGQAVAAVDIDVDQVGGGRLFTPNDNTDVNGDYRVVVPAGRFRFRYEPPRGSRIRGLEVDSVSVASDQTLDVSLPSGVLLEGRVTDPAGSPLAAIDIDLREMATGAKVFLSNNATDANGDYTVAAPAGTFELRYAPPRGSPYVAVAVEGFPLAGDVRRDQVLVSGRRVSFAVQDFNGAPVELADIDVKVSATAAKVFTPHDKTDTSGTADVALEAGTYDLRFDPPPGLPLDRVEMLGVVVRSDTSIAVVMPEAVRRRATGRVLDANLAPLANVRIEARLLPSGNPMYIGSPYTDAAGMFDLSIPIGTYEVRFIPPAGTRHVARALRPVAVALDSVWGDIPLGSGVLLEVAVHDAAGAPVSGADLDFFSETLASAVFVAPDLTDAAGRVTVAVSPDLYTIDVDPPVGSNLASQRVGPMQVNADGVLDVTLPGAASTPTLAFGAATPNPFDRRAGFALLVGSAASLRVEVYDLSGRKIRTLFNGRMAAGSRVLEWDGSTDTGARAPSSVYFVRATDGSTTIVRRALLLR